MRAKEVLGAIGLAFDLAVGLLALVGWSQLTAPHLCLTNERFGVQVMRPQPSLIRGTLGSPTAPCRATGTTPASVVLREGSRGPRLEVRV